MKGMIIGGLYILTLALLPARLPAQAAAAPAPLPALPEVVGMDLPAAYRSFGAPREVFVVRGSEAWQDDVVFFFDNRLYLFWLRDRVWQVRLDRGFDGEFLGLRMGLPRADVRARLGEPLTEGEGDLLFHLEDVGYPIRLRLLFEGDRLVDAYCYRSDF